MVQRDSSVGGAALVHAKGLPFGGDVFGAPEGRRMIRNQREGRTSPAPPSKTASGFINPSFLGAGLPPSPLSPRQQPIGPCPSAS